MRRIKENNDSHPDRNHRGFYEDSIGNLFRNNLSPSIRVVILMMLVVWYCISTNFDWNWSKYPPFSIKW